MGTVPSKAGDNTKVPKTKTRKPRVKKHLAVIAEPLRNLAVEINTLVPDGSNARVHDERNIEAIVASLKRFGQHTPILVEHKTRIVRAGNGRLAAARILGWSHIAVVFVKVSGSEATALAIADNRSAELGRWDRSALAAVAKELNDEQMAATGFTREDVESAARSLSKGAGSRAPLVYRVIVCCKDKEDQAGVLSRMKKEGYECRTRTS